MRAKLWSGVYILKYLIRWVNWEGWNAKEADPNDSSSNARRERKPVVPKHKERCLTATASWSWLYTLSLSDLHCWLIVCSCGPHTFLDLTGHSQESLLDVACVLCWGFEEWDTEAISEFLKKQMLVILPGADHRWHGQLRWFDQMMLDMWCYVPSRPCTLQPSCRTYRSCCPRGLWQCLVRSLGMSAFRLIYK